MSSTFPELMERERELANILAAVEAARAGSGRVLVVDGPAGIGKSRVLEAACECGRDRGCMVLSAASGEFERELGFGVVRQLFASVLSRSSAGEQRALLAGAAGLARPLLLPSARRAGAGTPDAAALMHGLYWLVANLSENRALVLCVDDVQWCDPASLGWLLYLARRLADLAVVLILAVRSGEARAQGGPLAALADADLAARLELSPLSEPASARLVRRAWGGGADEEVCRACFEVSGGNPFLLGELVRALDAETSSRTSALVERIRRLTPHTVSRSVLARLRRLPGEAAPVAYALAVLGDGADPRELMALAGVDRESGLRAIDALEREEIAGGRPVRFIHPLVGNAVYGELPPATRSSQHLRAARVLASAGADAGRVASHLMHVEPAGDEWTVQMLCRSARDANQYGSPQTAVQLLARALEEPPTLGQRAHVLHELGVAELLAGPSPSRSASLAERHLADAVEASSEARAKALAALDWGDALWATHRYTDAVRAFDRGIEAVGRIDSELALRIEAHAMAAARLDLSTCGPVSRRLARFGREPPATPAGGLIAGVMAIDRALAGDPAGEVVALAERMLEDGHLPSGRIAAQIPLFATNALLWADRLDRARRLLDQMIARARAAGSARGVLIALCWRGLAAHRCGSLGDAVTDLATAVELAAEHSSGGTVVTSALLAEALVDQGDLSGAAKVLAGITLPHELPGYIGWNYVLHARGVLHAAQLSFEQAVEEFETCGTRQERWSASNPSVMAWRSRAALAYHALGDHRRARELAAKELQLARRFGAPRALGTALCTLGLCERGQHQLALLREAVKLLEASQARLEHARALTELGGALRRSNQRASARDPLHQALQLATRCGAAPLAERARHELLATGARPRKQILTGASALTPIERQAATMAAQGMSNPQIAQALFISRKTVEKRLSEAYRKLDISSRNELATALGTPSATDRVVASALTS